MAINQGQITLDEAATIDKRLHTITRLSEAVTKHNEVFCIIDSDDASDTSIVRVLNAEASATDYGLVVRPIKSNRTASAALGALNAAVTLDANELGMVNWEIDTGTLVGTVVFEATLDDTNWFAIDAIQIGGTIITSTSSFADRGALTSLGYSQVRLRVSAYTSGTSNARAEGAIGAPNVVRLGDMLPAGTNNIGDVDIVSLPNEGQQTMANSISVAIASDQSVLSVDDNAGSLTVDAPVGTPVNAQISDGTETALVTVAGSLAVDIAEASATVTVDSELPAAAALTDAFANPTAPAVGAFLMGWDGTTDWERVQVTAGDLMVSLGGESVTVTGTVTADAGTGFPPVVTDGAAAGTTGIHVLGTDGTNAQILSTTVSGHLNIADGGNIITVDGTVTADAGTGPWPVTDNAGSLTVDAPVATPVNVQLSDGVDTALIDGSGRLLVDINAATATVTVSATDLDIRNLDPATDKVEVVGDGADDVAATGNPVLMGGVARTADRTAVAASDAVYATYDTLGKQVTAPYAQPDEIVWGDLIKSTTGFATLVAAPGAGVRNYITSFSVSNSSGTATLCTLRDSVTTANVVSFYVAASGGGVSHVMPVPWRLTANAALEVDIGAALSSLYFSAQGYTANN